MIDRPQLLQDLQPVIRALQEDLRTRTSEVSEHATALEACYERAKVGHRTGLALEVWRDDYHTQVAVMWTLATVFVRFLEDNHLIDSPRLSGPGDRFQRADDHRRQYFKSNPTNSDRDYLQATFAELSTLPGCEDLFGRKHNVLWQLNLSADGAAKLLQFWKARDPTSGTLVHDFTDTVLDTRFLGDLYQDLSEAARDRFALLQTPDFVEEFILDRTLTPAIAEFGLADVRLIDPACGSGHFLLGAFDRLFALWSDWEPATNPRDLTQRALNAIHGVDLNPFAVAIARFRLLIAALRVSHVASLAKAPGLKLNVTTGDSLLFGPRGWQRHLEGMDHPAQRLHESENEAELDRILRATYHVVVANPPYITVKDPVLNSEYRDLYQSCSGKYALTVPFTECIFSLAKRADFGVSDAGFVGVIMSNSFMKRNFGKKLVEKYLSSLDLTYIIDTSGAYIPGHGTPTAVLFARNRPPVAASIRAVLGIRGEPCVPADPSRGEVWSALLDLIDQPGKQSGFVSSADVPRDRFALHPWSIGGGGASELREMVEDRVDGKLGAEIRAVGFTAITGADDLLVSPTALPLQRAGLPHEQIRVFVTGDSVRDWGLNTATACVFPYGEDLQVRGGIRLDRYLWPCRTVLASTVYFGKIKAARGMDWREYAILLREKLRVPLSIAFAEVATDNHFVLDRGGKVFKQTAPVIKLPEGTSEDDHLGLLGLLNSSTASFWTKQVFHNKGSTVDQHGARQRTDAFEDFYQRDGSKMKLFPVTQSRPLALAKRLDGLAQELGRVQPGAEGGPSREGLEAAEKRAGTIREQMVGLQEELDWECYGLYGLVEEDLKFAGEVPGVRLGERAFEIVLARQMARGEVKTTWFERHGSLAVVEVPGRWPEGYRKVVERRIEVIAENSNVRLIEKPEYKRRWATEGWAKKVERALREWLLDRLEKYWGERRLISCSRVADLVQVEKDFVAVAELYRGRADFDMVELVEELVGGEGVPFLAALRYTEAGLRTRKIWERTWELQREEDAGKTVEIPVPPKYKSGDFQKASYWGLRGKLDVPRERFVLYPGAEREADGSKVVGWAGWDHRQQAEALAAYVLERREQEGWEAGRLCPLLAGLAELEPWLKQWHNELDPKMGMGFGDYITGFLDEELRSLELTRKSLEDWLPAKKTRKARAC